MLVGLFAVFRSFPLLHPPRAVVAPGKLVAAPIPSTSSAASSALIAPFRPAPIEADHATPVMPTPIYRCGNSYQQGPCLGGRAVDTAAASGFDSRPSELLARQVAEGRTNDVALLDRTITTTTMNGTLVASSDRATCAVLADEIVSIDRAALRPQTALMQDGLRRRRSEVRAQQVKSHCCSGRHPKRWPRLTLPIVRTPSPCPSTSACQRRRRP